MNSGKKRKSVNQGIVGGWPTLNFGEVFHVGSLNPQLKGATHNATSLEGNGLSVSLHPDAWRQIARLGGAPVWALKASQGSAFLNARAMSQPAWQTVMDWALTQGLVEPTQLIEVSWYDEDAGGRISMQFDVQKADAENDARAEFEEHEDLTPEVSKADALRATDALNSRIEFAVDIGMVKDMALTCYVEDVLHGLHGLQGVWWDDVLDVHSYSAPRGVIHHQAIDGWSRNTIQSDLPSRAQLKRISPNSLSASRLQPGDSHNEF